MQNMHRREIFHQDFKTSNVLIQKCCELDDVALHNINAYMQFVHCVVADFECFIGVVGTSFGQTLEILFILQTSNITLDTFTKMVDITTML
jgi:hypothetical protein